MGYLIMKKTRGRKSHATVPLMSLHLTPSAGRRFRFFQMFAKIFEFKIYGKFFCIVGHSLHGATYSHYRNSQFYIFLL